MAKQETEKMLLSGASVDPLDGTEKCQFFNYISNVIVGPHQGRVSHLVLNSHVWILSARKDHQPKHPHQNFSSTTLYFFKTEFSEETDEWHLQKNVFGWDFYKNMNLTHKPSLSLKYDLIQHEREVACWWMIDPAPKQPNTYLHPPTDNSHRQLISIIN